MEYEDCSSSSASSSSTDHLLLSPSSASSNSSPMIITSTRTSTNTPKRKAGRKKFRETRHPVYRGIRERKGGKWVCEVREPNKKSRIWLGTYPTPEMAARAHDVAAIALRGKSAVLNFADSASVLPRASTGCPDEIQRVASEAAEMYRSPSSTTCGSTSTSITDSSKRAAAMPAPGPGPAALFVDEEALFNMPGLMREMAQGMMLSPPQSQAMQLQASNNGSGGGGLYWDYHYQEDEDDDDDDDVCHLNISLWGN